MAISARQYADAVGTAEATAPAPAPARPSRIAAARRAELAAEAAATGGNDVLLTVPAIMAEPVRTPSATVRSYSNGGRVEEYESGGKVFGISACRARYRGGGGVNVQVNLYGPSASPRGTVHHVRRSPGQNCEQELAAAVAIFGSQLAGAHRRLEFADTLRRKLAQARDEVTRLRHLAEAQAAEIQGLRKDFGKRKRA